jgi:hypothetical protein
MHARVEQLFLVCSPHWKQNWSFLRASISTIRTYLNLLSKENKLLTVNRTKRSILRAILKFYRLKKKMLAGHIKVLGGLHLAHRPDVAQACPANDVKLFKK